MLCPRYFYADKALQKSIAAKADVYLLDHSGLRVSDKPFSCDPQGWDSGIAGIMYATKDDVIKDYGKLNDETITKNI